MHKNSLWLGLLAIVVLAAVWFAGKASWEVASFYSLSEKTKPHTTTLSVKKNSKSSYYPEVRYSYVVNGNEYQGREDLRSIDYFRKEFLEEDLPKIQAERKWVVWYSPKSPHRSALERNFPFKSIFYACVMTGIMIYFIWLGVYVGKR